MKSIQRLLSKLGKSRKSPLCAAREWPYELDIMELESRILYDAAPLDISTFDTYVVPQIDGDFSVLMDLADKLTADDANSPSTDWWYDHKLSDEQSSTLAKWTSHQLDLSQVQQALNHFSPETTWESLEQLLSEINADQPILLDDSAHPSPISETNELILIDRSVENYQQLVDDILNQQDRDRIFSIIYIDDTEDGIDQVSRALSAFHNLAAIHIVSHSQDGQLQLGSSLLDSSNLALYSEAIAGWQSALNREADLLFYGCDLAGTADGAILINELAALTGADVAASDDLTGHASLGGDWDLEYRQGSIESSLAFSVDAQQHWHELLSASETGSSIAINTFTTDTQETNASGGKAVATNDNGDFVVVWQSKKQDVPGAGDYGVFAQVLDSSGNPLTAEIPVNDFVAKDQISPAVAMADDGSFIVVWASEDQDLDGGNKSWGIYGMRFDAAGNPLDVPGSPGVSEFRINTHIAGDQLDPAVAMNGDGDFVVTWTSMVDQAGPNSKQDIFYRRFGQDGNALDATDVLVNTQISFDQYGSAVDMNDNGHFVVTWTANGNQDGDGFGVYAQKFDADGLRIGGERLVNSETIDDQFDSSVGIANNGEFVVVWTSLQHPQTAGNDAIIAQLFASNAARIGSEIVVSSALPAVDHTDPSVSMSGGGQFVVSWTEVANKQIYYQEFSEAGTAQDQTLPVDTADTVNQRNSSVAIQDDGDFIVVWTGDGSGLPLPVYDNFGVFAQRFGFDNEAPVLDLPGTPIIFYENDPPMIIDGGAIVTDVDSANFQGGRLVVDYLAGGTANDRLAINHQGSGANQIGVLASSVSYEGVTIGTFSGGHAAAPLVITLNANASVAATEALARNITFENLPNDPDTSDRTVRFTLHDGDGSTSDPVVKTVSITLVNDAPNIQGITSKTILEDDTIQFQNADLIQITDTDAASSELRVTLSVSHGVINLNTTNNLTFYEGTLDGQNYLVFSGTLTAINNALDKMEYVPIPLFVGTAQLVMHVDDQGNTGAGGAQTDDHIVDITINSDGTNDTPKNIKPGNQTIIEDEQLVFSTDSGNRLWVQDDAGSNEIHVTLEVLEAGLPSAKALVSLNDLTGLTFIEGGGSGYSRIKVQGTLDNINNALDGLIFESVGGPANLKLRILTEDLGWQGVGGLKTGTDDVTVNVLERNDAPVITAPDSVTIGENSPLFFDVSKPIDIADPDATGDLEVSLLVSHGVLKLGSIAGLTFISGGDNSAAMIFKGNLSELDSALNNLRYTPTAGYAGPDNLQITVNDLGGNGAGGAQIDAETIEIAVTSDGTNAAPINTVPPTQNTDEEQSLELSDRFGNAISIADDAGNDFIQVTLEVNDGTLSLSNTVGTEFVINSYTADNQQLPQVAIDEDGNYVVVWQSQGQDGSDEGIYAQLFNSSGVKTGPEFKINDSTAGDQEEPSVAMDKDGNFVVVWTGSEDAGGHSKAVYARVFDANATDLSGELLVNQHTPGDQSAPAVAMNWQTGDFVVTWQSKDQINEWDVFARKYGFNLLTVGNEFQVNNSTVKSQTDASISMNKSGEFIIAWESDSLGADNSEVYYRRFNSAGEPIDLVDRLASDNSTKNQKNASVAIDNAGNYAVAWQSEDQDYADGKYGIYAQIWDNAGTEIRNEFVVNDTLRRDQTNPAIAMSGDGEFIVSWQAKSATQDAGFEIYAKRYGISGAQKGSEFLVNLTTGLSQENPDIALNGDGQFVVVWQSKDQDGSDQGIFGQQYKDVRSLNFVEGDGVDDARIVVAGTLHQINDALDGLVYQPNADFVGTDTLTITTDDQHASSPQTDIDAFNIVVGPINDAPTIANPGLQLISQDSILTFAAGVNEIRIDDVDNPATVHSVTLTAKHGDVTLFNIGGLVSLTGNGSSLVTLSGTLATINAALDGMQFEPTEGYAGAASIFVRAEDPGEPAAGDELTAADTIFVQVIPDLANDAPVLSVPGPQRTAKNVDLFLDSTINANAISINDDSAAEIIEVAINVTNGTITLSDSSSSDISRYKIQTGNQLNTAVGIFADGGSVAVWESPNHDGNGTAIVAQRFNSEGQAMSDEFVVNSFFIGNQVGANVATGANGNFVVTWSSTQDGSGNGVYAQLYDNLGNRIGSEFIINSTTAGEQQLADVAMADDGSFVAVWQSSGGLDGSGEGIFAQRYDGNGVSLGDQFQVNSTTAGNQTLPAIAMSGATGDFVITWQDVDNNGKGVFAQRFDKDGVPVGNQFLVNTTTLSDQKVPDVAMDDSGNFVIVWESTGEDGSGTAIIARRYDSDGFAQGGGFVVNEFTAGNQVAPRVAMNGAPGDFVILWQSAEQDGDGDAVVGQRFDAAGTRVGSEFIVNSDPTGDQQLPSVAMNEKGQIVAGFNGGDANGDGVFVKLVLPNNAIQFISGSGVEDTFVRLRGTLADINAALDGSVFKPNVDFVGVATVDIDVNDLGNSGSGGPLLDSQTLDIIVGNSPSVDLDADNSSGSGSYHESVFVPGGGPIAISDLDTAIINPARGTLSSMTVRISNLLDGANEILSANVSGTSIVASPYSSGVLSLSGTDSLANYELLLSRITYNNLAASPTLGTRVLEVTVKDGAVTSNIAYSHISYPNAPSDIAPDSFSLNEGIDTTGGVLLDPLATSDLDIGDTFTYSFLPGFDESFFSLRGSGDELYFDAGILDFEADATYSVNVQVEDSFGNTYVEMLTLSVNDLNESPIVNNQAFPIDENVGNSTIVGSIAASDLDAGLNGDLTFAVTGGTGTAAFNVDSSGQITVANSSLLDYETANSYTLDVLVTDGGTPGLTDTATITINLNDLNEAPIVNNQAFPIDENASNGTIVGSIAASDLDAGLKGDLTFAVTGGTGTTAFNVNNSGQITVADSGLLDYETTTSYTLDVLVTDGGTPGLTDTATITIDLNDLNEAPIVNNQTFPIDENASNGTIVGSIATSDLDAGFNGNLTFAVTGGTGTAAFNVNSSGQITVADSSLLDYETTISYTLDVLATDSGAPGLTDAATITINLNDLNEAPTAIAPMNFNINENTDTFGGQSFGPLAATDVDAGDTFTYTIVGGADAAKFTIGGAGGNELILTDDTLNFEDQSSYIVDVEVEDAGGLKHDETVTVNVIDLNETPINLLLSNSVLADGIDTSGGHTVGLLNTVDFDSPESFTYTIVGGADAIHFSIGGAGFNELILHDGILNAAIQSNYEVTVRTTDSGSNAIDRTFNINVQAQTGVLWFSTFLNDVAGSGVAELPNWTNSQIIQVGDPNLSYGASTIGYFSTVFDLMSFVDPITTDADIDGIHFVSRDVIVNGMNLLEGDILLSTDQSVQIGGFTYTSGDLFLFRPTTVGDLSAGSFQMVYDGLAENNLRDFAIVEKAVTVGDANLSAGTILYTQFGSVVFSEEDLLRRNPGDLISTVLVDGSNIGLFGNTLRGVELIQDNMIIGGYALDAGDLLLTMGIAQENDIVGDNNLFVERYDIFELDVNSTGLLTTSADAFIFFDGSDVQLDEIEETSYPIALVLDAFNSPPTDIMISDNTVNENIDTSSEFSVGTLSATDPDSLESFIYDIFGGADASKFSIGGAGDDELVLSHGTLNYEAKSSYSVDVRVTDSKLNTYIETITVNVSDLNEAPTAIAATSFDIDENTDTASNLSLGKLTTTDEDASETFTYNIVGGADALKFSIGGGSLDELVIHDGVLDHETKDTYTVDVEVEDSGGNTRVETITVNVKDVNDDPIITTTGFNIIENTTVVGNITATDEDIPANAFTYSLTGNGTDDGLFTINPSTGALHFNVAPDFETPSDGGANNVYDLEIKVDDGKGGSDTKTVTVTVLNSDEIPTTNGIADLTRDEDSVDQFVDLHAAFDDAEDPDPALTYAIISNSNPGLFNSVSITPGDLLQVDFADDQNGFSDITVRATDTAGQPVHTTFRINVDPINDNPFVDSSIAPLSVGEDDLDTVIDLSAVFADVDIATNGDMLSYSIVSSSNAGLVDAVVTGNNLILDYLDDQFGLATVVVRATDLAGKFVDEAVDILVNAANDAPLIGNNNLTLSEGDTVTLTAAKLSGTDIDNPNPSLVFTVSNVVGGHFESTLISGTPITAFTQAQVTAGQIVFVDDADEFAPRYDVEISDGLLSDGPRAATIHFNNLNDAPTVNPATMEIDENSANGTMVGTVVANDPDTGDMLSYAIIAGDPTNAFAIDSSGKITVNDQNQLNFETMPTSYLLTVEVTDSGGLKETATIIVDVNDINESPSIIAQTFTVGENSPIGATSQFVIAGDIDAGDEIHYSIIGHPAGSPFVIDAATGEILIVDVTNLDYEFRTGWDLVVEAEDSLGWTDSATITVDIADWDEQPIAKNDSFTLLNDQPLIENSGRILDNDFDPEHQPLLVSVVDNVDHGTLTLQANGSFIYVPDTGFVGTDKFTYIVDDGGNMSLPATVKLDVVFGVGTSPPTVSTDDDITGPVSTDPPPIMAPVFNNDEATVVEADPAKTTFSASGSYNLPTQNLADVESVLAEATQLESFDLPIDAGQYQSDLSMLSKSTSVGLDHSNVSDDLIYLANSNLWSELATMNEDLELNPFLRRIVVSSLAGFSGALTVGYVLWIIRGGYLMASVLSSLPAWRFVDPLPILDILDDSEEDRESIQSILEESNANN